MDFTCSLPEAPAYSAHNQLAAEKLI